MKILSRQLSERIRHTREATRERREHDTAMSDPRIRDEHFAARARDVAAGKRDCHFCI